MRGAHIVLGRSAPGRGGLRRSALCRSVLGALSACALAVSTLTGCDALSTSSGPSEPSASASAGGTASVRPSGYGAVFLAVDECSSFGTTSFTEVPCTSERAAARVVARYDGKVADGPSCPANTDFVLHISETRPASDEDGDGAVPQGYACMRKLAPPHPGDPGGGGGPRTVVGDCVYSSGSGEVRETACDGKGDKPPEYKVTSAVEDRSQCPPSTDLYVQLGGVKPVGCARPV
ncbi:hypothetical protein [Streptomyces sp. NBC_00038]|uniref:hypothetical protein n=1 Tax=Streptomyces sp. NBC_00038 TaxID=2903615 RepID=UPI00225BE7AF|nr:hypothetical protein [Streptomyces sp. NBC_00038]MCX5557882.1 hypothetical protein [Streptomyces sp. NBC_00038]